MPPANACVDLSPTGPITGTFVCLPGVNSGAYLFEGASTTLSPHWRIIAFNPPGVQGMPLTLPLTARSYAEQVLGLLQKMQAPAPWVILGHSLGGFAAQELAHMAPENVARLILVSTSRGQPDMAKDVARLPLHIGLDFWAFQRLIDAKPAEAQKHIFGPGFATREPLKYNWFLTQRQAHLPSQAATLAHLTAGGMFSSTAWVEKLTCPTLVLQGDADIIVSFESGKALAQSIPHARFLGLHNVGHFPMLEHPQFWQYVAAFSQGMPLGEETDAPRGFFQRLKERLWRAG